MQIKINKIIKPHKLVGIINTESSRDTSNLYEP